MLNTISTQHNWYGVKTSNIDSINKRYVWLVIAAPLFDKENMYNDITHTPLSICLAIIFYSDLSCMGWNSPEAMRQRLEPHQISPVFIQEAPLTGVIFRLGHTRKLPVTLGKAMIFPGYTGFLHHVQLASHDFLNFTQIFWPRLDLAIASRFVRCLTNTTMCLMKIPHLHEFLYLLLKLLFFISQANILGFQYISLLKRQKQNNQIWINMHLT